MDDRETARMLKYGESKTTRIMMATVPHVTSGLELRKYQGDGFFWHECTSSIAGTYEFFTYFSYVSSPVCGDEPMCPLLQHGASEIRGK